MTTEQTYGDHLRSQELMDDLARAFGFAEDLERCPMCGDHYPEQDFSDYKGQRMCYGCEDLERTNDAAASLRPDFG